MGIEEYIGIGMSYLKQGLSFIREWTSKIISFAGVDGNLFTMILMMALSLLLARLIAKRYVTKPFSGTYLIFTLVIALLIFTILMYL